MQPRFPLPWWTVWHASALETATGAVRRAATMLAIAYWAGGCKPIPDDDATQAAIVRMHAVSWRETRDVVLAAFATMRAELDAAHAKAMRKYAKRSDIGRRAWRQPGGLGENIAARARERITAPRERGIPPALVIGVPGNPVTPPIPHGLFRE